MFTICNLGRFSTARAFQTRPLMTFPSADSSKYTSSILSHRLVESLKSRGFQRVSHLLYENNEHVEGSLTGDTLSGDDKIAKFPVFYSLLAYDAHKEVATNAKGLPEDYNELYAFYHLGSKLHGHPGIVHGGLLATILDETLYRCCYPLIIQRGKSYFGVTANLNINYRSPTYENQFIVVKTKIQKVEGHHKYFIEGRIESLLDSPLSTAVENKKSTLLAEATQLIVVPKWLDK